MLKQRRQAAQDVIDRLMPAEEALDIVLARWSELTSAIPSARLSAGVAAEVVDDVMVEAAKTFACLVQARSSMVSTHREMAKVRTQMGLDAVAFGGLMPKAAIARVPLRVVKAA